MLDDPRINSYNSKVGSGLGCRRMSRRALGVVFSLPLALPAVFLPASTATAAAPAAAVAPFHLSCPSASLCVAVDAAGHVLTSSDPAAASSSWTIRDVDGTNQLLGLACPTAFLCVAVDDAGNVLSASDPAGGAAAWTRSHVGTVADVACPSTSLCVAVGARNVYVSTKPLSASSWTELSGVDQTVGPECGKYSPGEDCDAALIRISCPSTDLCSALDTQGGTVSSSLPAGGAGDWTSTSIASGPERTDLSCQANGRCFGVCPVGEGLLGQACTGAKYDDGDIVAPAASVSGSLEQIATTPLTGIWCPSSGACFASDSFGHLYASSSPSAGAGTWQLSLSDTTATPSGLGFNPVEGVSCPGSSCFAIDHSGDAFTTAPPPTSAAQASRRAARRWFRRTAHVRTRPARETESPAHSVSVRFHGRAPAPDRRLVPPPIRPMSSAERRTRMYAFRHHRPATARPAVLISTKAYGISDSASYSMTNGNFVSNANFAYCTQAGQVPCSSVSGYATLGSPATPEQVQFYYFRGAASYARFFIPYDAVETWDAQYSKCVPSSAYLSGIGQQDFAELVAEVKAAQADGLKSVVAFKKGTGAAPVDGLAADPIIPDPTYGTSGSNPYAGFTLAGMDYECGVYGIMANIAQAGLGSAPVSDWEAWNEPNGASQDNSLGGGYNGSLGICDTGGCVGSPSNPGNPSGGYPSGPCGSMSYAAIQKNGPPITEVNDCGGQTNSQLGNSVNLCYSSSYKDCGPIEATGLWVLAQFVSQAYFGGSFKVAALTMSDAENLTYGSAYEGDMVQIALCSPGYYCNGGLNLATVWSVHDYDDPGSIVPSAHGAISSFTSNLVVTYSTANEVWITEAANDLNSPTQSDPDRAHTTGCPSTYAADCTGYLWQAVGNMPACTSSEPDHYSSTPGNPSTAPGFWEFGACLDQQPLNQYTGGETFLGLYQYGNGLSITQTDWYELEAPNPSSGYDSGLLSPGVGTGQCQPVGSTYNGVTPYCVPAGGSYSAPRYSLCALDNVSTNNCSASGVDASDWSTQAEPNR
jgi:hypothetical protein